MEATKSAIALPETAEDEIYVGIVANTAGELHHVILLPGDNDDASWQAQMEWAQSIGGDLPTRIEMLFLLENHRGEFERDAYWTCQPDTDPGYSGWAWCQSFYNGSPYDPGQYGRLRARAVRRLSIQ
ncbi:MULTISPECIES: DUF1566 domain-containing protein [unclassified Burkholderia]|uniref:DUF1566 domain-containing protein n=1 Tax=unclassified Burkholderia TaxID=2613784 RepID=UPI000F57CB7B|nr:MULTISPECIES: DUF1566 domain-containing protein [unclassified Burkholderia]RQS29432.1 DUF1566 domain-containing protein [Burkholderia sp. Bp8995]RQS47678.1 DUF1566 domain-containing protein [Burkholderia sp. Bp8989]